MKILLPSTPCASAPAPSARRHRPRRNRLRRPAPKVCSARASGPPLSRRWVGAGRAWGPELPGPPRRRGRQPVPRAPRACVRGGRARPCLRHTRTRATLRVRRRAWSGADRKKVLREMPWLGCGSGNLQQGFGFLERQPEDGIVVVFVGCTGLLVGGGERFHFRLRGSEVVPGLGGLNLLEEAHRMEVVGSAFEAVL